MNSFGRLFRVSILGESHGECVGVIIDGCPAGLPLSEGDFLADLVRRRSGREGTTARHETDMPFIKSGIFKGKTTGAPILILFENRDIDSSPYERIKNTPRPGHADFTAFHKYGGFNDYRGGGHFSGRLTVGLVAAGVIAKMLIRPVTITAALTDVGGSRDVKETVKKALTENDTVGGIVECRTPGIPIGLGEPFFDSLESLVSHAVFAIPGIKAIEFGAGFRCSAMAGSQFNDAIMDEEGKTATNYSGGVNGGITNGNELVFRVAVKPASSTQRPQRTISLADGGSVDLAIGGRHDTCIALRMPVIVEAVTAFVLADLMTIEQRIPRVMR
jgi:chorismate synthase